VGQKIKNILWGVFYFLYTKKTKGFEADR